jgi:hypothetical protein
VIASTQVLMLQKIRQFVFAVFFWQARRMSDLKFRAACPGGVA